MKPAWIALLSLFLSGAACAQDGFEKVRCGGDIAAAVIGRRGSDEPVAAIEARHKDIGLADLGADEISDRLNAISWRICGREYLFLEDSVVRDVLPLPPHSKQSPEFGGSCQIDGKDSPGYVVAILDNRAGSGALLSATSAWKVDEKLLRFVKIPTDRLRCPRSGIGTADGGE